MMSKKIEIPSLEDEVEYMAAETKLSTLKATLLTARTKRDEILADLNSPRPGANPLQDAAMRLLNGDETTLQSAAITQLREGYKDLTSRIEVIRAAIQIQKGTVEKLLADASHRAGELVKPLHRELVRDVAEKIKALDAALAAEFDLRDSMFQAGFSVAHEIRPMGLNALGMLSNEYSRASLYLLESYREGFISVNELPENLQRQIAPDTPAKVSKLTAAVERFDGWLLAG